MEARYETGKTVMSDILKADKNLYRMLGSFQQ